MFTDLRSDRASKHLARVAAVLVRPWEGGDMIKENDWSRNEGMKKVPDEPDNFLGGQLLASRDSKRQVTADHLAISYWKQEEINSMEEVNPTVEEALPPRSQYTERVLQGLVSNAVIASQPLIEPNPALQMESLASIKI